MALYQLRRTQHLSASPSEVWDFIASPRNLKRITPDYMGFDITGDPVAGRMYPGQIITYKVHPLMGIPVEWVTEITHIVEGEYFVDEQRVGPYALWHHEHWLQPVGDEVRMTDLVSYRPPFGPLGRLLHGPVIRPKLEEIFNYREKALRQRFSGP